jgi:hypothetical protein
MYLILQTQILHAVTNAITNEVPLGNVQKGIGAFTPPGIDDLQSSWCVSTIQPVTPSAATPFNMTGYDDAGQYGVRPDYLYRTKNQFHLLIKQSKQEKMHIVIYLKKQILKH